MNALARDVSVLRAWRSVDLRTCLPYYALSGIVQHSESPLAGQVSPLRQVLEIECEQRFNLARHPRECDVRQSMLRVAAADIRVSASEPNLLKNLTSRFPFRLLLPESRLKVLAVFV